jgi:hypothetical protein
MAGIFTLESSLNFVILYFCLLSSPSVGKKTALLQAEVLACAVGLVNVLFCALACHFLISVFLFGFVFYTER